MPPAQASSSKLKSNSATGKVKAAKKPIADSAVDIDSIFSKPTKPKSTVGESSSSKGKEKARDEKAVKSSTGVASGSEPSGISKKKKKAKKTEGDAIKTTEPVQTSDRVVEVVDTSIPKAKEVVEPVKATKGKKRDKKDAEEDEMFADSRGTGPSTFSWRFNCSKELTYLGRKTEEGFLIYKEAELDIDPEAGGTDLCPFDCECCKSRSLQCSRSGADFDRLLRHALTE